MKNKTILSVKNKFFKKVVVCLLVGILITLTVGCGQNTSEELANTEVSELEVVEVEREAESEELQIANEATTIALKQYLYARLLTEAYVTMDVSNMDFDALNDATSELYAAWENAKISAQTAEDIANRTVTILESAQLSRQDIDQSKELMFARIYHAFPSFSIIAQAAESGRKLDPQTWAENLTKQYDALQGGKRYQQLANQLGVDAKTAFEQMELAQKIIQNAAALEEAEGEVNAWTDSINYLMGIKTASKVGVFVVGTVVTGGGTLSALGASSMSLPTAGAVIVGGADCIVDIATTGSTIILGENDQVTLGFNDLKDILGPVSAVVGLATFNGAETGEQLSYIGDTLTDWFFENKVMGIKLDDKKVSAKIYDNTTEAEVEKSLQEDGFTITEESSTLDTMLTTMENNPSVSLEKLESLLSKLLEAEIEQGQLTEQAEEVITEEVVEFSGSIFGTYELYSVVNSSDEVEDETETIRIVDNQDGTITWITSDEDETILDYDTNTQSVYYDTEEIELRVQFSSTGGQVTGTGYMRGTFWDSPLDVSLTLRKISD